MPNPADFEILRVGCRAKKERLSSSHRSNCEIVISRTAEDGEQLCELLAVVFLSRMNATS